MNPFHYLDYFILPDGNQRAFIFHTDETCCGSSISYGFCMWLGNEHADVSNIAYRCSSLSEEIITQILLLL